MAISAPASDQLAQVLTGVVRDLDGADELDVTVTAVDEAAGRRQVEDGDAAIALLVPEGFGEAVRAGQPVDVKAVRGDEAGIEADIVLSVVDGLLGQFASGAVTARAALAEGVSHAELDALLTQATAGGPAYELSQGEASDEQATPGPRWWPGRRGCSCSSP